MATDKIYCGVGKLKDSKYGDRLELTLWEKDIAAINARWESVRSGKFPAVKLVIQQRKEPSEKGYTHYGVIDTWEPKPRSDEQPGEQPLPRPTPPKDEPVERDGDQLPF